MAVPLRDWAVPCGRDSRAASGARSTYREFAPPASIASAAFCVWEGRAGWARPLRLLPDGRIDLVWDGTALWVSPSAPVAVREPLRRDGLNIGVRLRSGAGGAFLGVRADALPTSRLRLETLWGRVAKTAEAVLGEAQAASEARLGLERLVAARLSAGPPLDAAVLAACGKLRQTGVAVDEVASAVGLGPRALRRRFHAEVGYGPKTLQRIFRFQALLRALAGRAGLAAAALDAGYADQAHMTREARRLSGSTPSALLRSLSL